MYNIHLREFRYDLIGWDAESSGYLIDNTHRNIYVHSFIYLLSFS